MRTGMHGVIRAWMLVVINAVMHVVACTAMCAEVGSGRPDVILAQIHAVINTLMRTVLHAVMRAVYAL
jgi:hypothetical protein